MAILSQYRADGGLFKLTIFHENKKVSFSQLNMIHEELNLTLYNLSEMELYLAKAIIIHLTLQEAAFLIFLLVIDKYLDN